jgi:hypothetical protein
MAGWLILISTDILLSLSLKPRLSGFGRVVWPGGGAGPRDRSPPPRRPGGGAGRRDGGPLLRSTLMAVLPCARPPRRPLRCATSNATPSYARPRRRIEDGHNDGGSTFSMVSRRRLSRPRVLSRVERRAPRHRRLKVSVSLRARPRCPPRHLSFRVRNTT